MGSDAQLNKTSKNIPEYDTYIPHVGENEHGDFREPMRKEYLEAFNRHAKGGLFGGRDLELYIMQGHRRY